TFVFVVQNVPMSGDMFGGGGAKGLGGRRQRITVQLAAPVRDVIDERTGRPLGDGRRFAFEWNPIEAVFFSFRGPLPRA
ncbi:MAG: beta-galactosidase, partial [Planctomycetes bacterium]|nr:beta-galactosidase [Planctomycetota bacterium]